MQQAIHAMVLDTTGRAALIRHCDIPHGLFRLCEGVKLYETGEVLKAPNGKFEFPSSAPLALPIFGQTFWGRETFGAEAIVWRLGWKCVANDFSIPPRAVLDKCYYIIEGSARPSVLELPTK